MSTLTTAQLPLGMKRHLWRCAPELSNAIVRRIAALMSETGKAPTAISLDEFSSCVGGALADLSAEADHDIVETCVAEYRKGTGLMTLREFAEELRSQG